MLHLRYNRTHAQPQAQMLAHANTQMHKHTHTHTYKRQTPRTHRWPIGLVRLGVIKGESKTNGIHFFRKGIYN